MTAPKGSERSERAARRDTRSAQRAEDGAESTRTAAAKSTAGALALDRTMLAVAIADEVARTDSVAPIAALVAERDALSTQVISLVKQLDSARAESASLRSEVSRLRAALPEVVSALDTYALGGRDPDAYSRAIRIASDALEGGASIGPKGGLK